MTANDNKSYLSFLNNQQKSITNDEMLINADYSALTKNVETNSKTPKLKVNDKVRITRYKNIFSKG